LAQLPQFAQLIIQLVQLLQFAKPPVQLAYLLRLNQLLVQLVKPQVQQTKHLGFPMLLVLMALTPQFLEQLPRLA
jgi:hypothetical protein